MNPVVVVASIAIASLHSHSGQIGNGNSRINSLNSIPASVEFEKSDIRFSSSCEFGTARNLLMAGFRPKPDRAVVTNSHLHLITRHEPYLFFWETTTTPFDEYKCISLTDTQIQLTDERGHILAIRFNSPLARKAARNKSREIYRILVDSGIREMASSKKFAKLRRPIRRVRMRSSGRGDGGFCEQQPPRPNEPYGPPPVGGRYDR